MERYEPDDDIDLIEQTITNDKIADGILSCIIAREEAEGDAPHELDAGGIDLIQTISEAVRGVLYDPDIPLNIRLEFALEYFVKVGGRTNQKRLLAGIFSEMAIAPESILE